MIFVEKFLDFLLQDWIGLTIQLYFAIGILLLIFNKKGMAAIMTGVLLIVLGLNGSYKADAVNMATILNGILWIVYFYVEYKKKQQK